MRFIGPHVSSAGGLPNAVSRAKALGATGFALFVKNQRQWVGKPLETEEVSAFRAAMTAEGYTPGQVLPHAGYLINLANPDPEKHARSMDSFMDELHRCEALGLTLLNVHPGSHLNALSVEAACDRVAESINAALAHSSGVTVVIENTAGQGAYLGSQPEELGRILAGVTDKTRIGFCIDTCHALAAGHELRTEAGFNAFFEALDRAIGLRYLRGLHLNDSKGELGTHLDRHESLGKGSIGWETFERIALDARFQDIPIILETPDESLWAAETAHLLNL